METIFIAWSGPDSKAAAQILREDLPIFFSGLKIFMSKHDVASGVRWLAEVSSELAQSNFGIICLTPDNLDAPWIMFEAGALTKNATGRACGLLFRGLVPATITGPLDQFQNREFSKEDFRQLLHDINKVMNPPVEPGNLDRLFEKFWPDTSRKVADAMEKSQSLLKPPRREQQDLLEEILVRVRTIEGLARRGEGLNKYMDEVVSHLQRQTELTWKKLNAFLRVRPEVAREWVEFAFGDARKVYDFPVDDQSPAKQKE